MTAMRVRVAAGTIGMALLPLLIVHAQSSSLTENLSLGSSGPQVLALQRILNEDPSTRIAAIGPGSPGNETAYFGSLTRTAVIRFQNAHASEVLAPAGLSAATGYVGAFTRAALNAQEAHAGAAPAAAPTPGAQSGVSATTSVSTGTSPSNPNAEALSIILSEAVRVAQEQRMSIASITAMKAAITERLSTTTDIRVNFLKSVPTAPLARAAHASPLALFTHAVAALFLPRHAEAATGAPFGGALLGALPCDGGIWNIYVEPLPPTYVASLSYVSGSQLYMQHSIPAATYLLGAYAPVPGAYCWLGYVPVPSEGMISPMVGSSL